MNRYLHLLAAAAVLALTALACSESPDLLDPLAAEDAGLGAPAKKKTPDPPVMERPDGEPISVPLTSPRAGLVGAVEVSHDDASLYVTFVADEGWGLHRTRMAFHTSLDGFPRPSGRRTEGLAYQTRHSGVAEYTYTIPLRADWLEEGQDLYIAADAILLATEIGLTKPQGAFAWVEGEPFPGPYWRTYFVFTIEPPGSGGDCTITVVYPNGGEALCVSQYEEILWTADGESCGSFVRIELLRDGAPCLTITESALNTGFFAWEEVGRCGEELGGYTIVVTEIEGGAFDESDDAFEIEVCPE